MDSIQQIVNSFGLLAAGIAINTVWHMWTARGSQPKPSDKYNDDAKAEQQRLPRERDKCTNVNMDVVNLHHGEDHCGNDYSGESDNGAVAEAVMPRRVKELSRAALCLHRRVTTHGSTRQGNVHHRRVSCADCKDVLWKGIIVG